jgi:hypothetical protein
MNRPERRSFLIGWADSGSVESGEAGRFSVFHFVGAGVELILIFGLESPDNSEFWISPAPACRPDDPFIRQQHILFQCLAVIIVEEGGKWGTGIAFSRGKKLIIRLIGVGLERVSETLSSKSGGKRGYKK